MKLEFTKMQGAGNDFVVLDGIRQSINPTPELIRALADRRFGIGADQVLLLEAAKHEGEPLRYRIFNNTGGEVEQCGNGARCIGRFALEAGYAAGDRVDFETMKGRICVRAEPDGRMVVDMGVPRLLPAQVPFVPEADSEMSKRCEHSTDVWTIFCPPLGRDIEFTAVGMGNPHATIFVDNVESFPVEPVARFLQTSAVFPEDVNVGFVERIDSRTAKIRVYERGAGETLACGTGTSAAMASGCLRGFFDDRVEFAARGGRIACAWRGPATSLYLIGPAEVVFVGTISLDI